MAICAEEGHHWDAIKLLRASLEWAKEQGHKRWLLSSSETDHPIGKLAERIGAQALPFYGLKLGERE